MKIALIGYGKMGRMIESIALSRKHEIVGILDPGNTHRLDDETLEQADVAIEFTLPGACLSNYEKCFSLGVSVVSGTTGWLAHWDQVITLAEQKKVGFFYASNFSLGVNLFFELNKTLTRLLSGHESYKVSLDEIHHTQKLDAPSGTAISLADDIATLHPNYSGWHLNDHLKTDDIPIFSKREGQVTGTHRVNWVSETDKITISHEAFSRQGFALGAVVAAEFMRNRTGIYNMGDLMTNKP